MLLGLSKIILFIFIFIGIFDIILMLAIGKLNQHEEFWEGFDDDVK